MRCPSTSSSLLNAVRTVRVGGQRHGLALKRRRVLAQASGSRGVSTGSSEPATPAADGGGAETGPLPPPASLAPSAPPPAPPPPPVEKAERGRRMKSTPPAETVDWPDDLDVLWSPVHSTNTDAPDPATLPPAHILDEALDNLLITLHPQTQNRAVYASPTGPAVEPTLALYCPIEGGEYVVDATVKEMARRIGAEVLVLDAVQLAAGEWGAFGKPANMLRLPRNPLHFRASSTSAPPSSKAAEEDEEDDDEDTNSRSFPAGQMMLTVMSPSSTRGTVVSASKLSNSMPSKTKLFFDALVNMPSWEGPKSPSVPRIIYVRDFTTLASTSAAWYRPLLNAVRQRRRGPIASPSSPVSNPTTIVFGICPPITPPEIIIPASPSASSGLLSLLMNRGGGPAPVTSAPRPGKFDWNEDEGAVKAREARLRRRLKKWERGDAFLLEELPPLINQEEGEETDSKRNEVFMLGGKAIPLPYAAQQNNSSNRQTVDQDSKSSFFRTSILVPSARSIKDERECRVERRREINELTTRMAIGAVGGALDPTRAVDLVPDPYIEADDEAKESEIDGTPPVPPEPSTPSAHEEMWEEWGKQVELWMTVKHVADRAVGSVVARSVFGAQKQSLEATPVPWEAVSRAWNDQRSVTELRKTWFKEAVKASQPEKSEADGDVEEITPTVDEVIEKMKNDPELDTHEQRLLPCIVDPVTMPTSFAQVHLPTQTIDSVRTIVSLPLLHPQAFQQGILKEHSITGCLLFGPPGTGKTLIVRALAKEAGCRMMSVSPSDVMDMYVGEGEKLVKAVFNLARKLSPCVVFLDEIDSLLGARSSGRESGSSAAYRGVITEFMQEMDGLKTLKDTNVIVIGATNRPFDLDDAVLRRLPRRLLVDLPGEKEREEILKIMLRNEKLDADVDVKDLAKRTESFSGSDLKHLCVSAAVDAVKEHVELPWLVADREARAETSVAKAEEPLAEDSSKAAPSEDSSAEASEAEASAADASAAEASTEAVAETSPEVSAEPVQEESSSEEPKPEPTTSAPTPDEKPIPLATRILSKRHFTKALREITPSSSEATGTLTALRKWNEDFGEGRRERKRKQIWGKGRFGFTDPTHLKEEDGRVLPSVLTEPIPAAAPPSASP